ncbi:MAG: GTPase [Alphaproteobacteria bacterium]|nr:GTPase [Alphaproteobacteria bacterium]
MRLKSFHGATLTDAMRAVRDALGENAIIVATREEESGGIRVTAAIDESGPNRTEADPELPAQGSEALEIIAEALTMHHVPPDLAEKLMAAATQFAEDDPLVCLGAALDTHFKFDPVESDKPLMLVGPPGAGKTLCTAKFATQAVMDKRDTTVVSTDIERAGGLEQLAAFTRLLKIDLVEIDEWYALRDLISVKKAGPVFIDTAGRNPFDPKEKAAVADFIRAVGDATLVLPAGLDASEAIDLALEYKSIGASRLLITRMDVVKRLGSLLRLGYETQMPFANFSASAKVTDAPQPMNPVVIARKLLGKDSGFKVQDSLKSEAPAIKPSRKRIGAQ